MPTVTPLPPLGKHFTVWCDQCRKTYTYKPKDVQKAVLELPESFKPFPLFREDAEAPQEEKSGLKGPGNFAHAPSFLMVPRQATSASPKLVFLAGLG